MTARRIIVPGAMPSRDANGRALPAKLRFYEPDTDTLATVYTSAALTVPHSQPILSTSTGHFAAIWADDANSFDVAWSDQSFDRQLATYTDVEPAADAVLSSAALSESAQVEAEASAVAALASEAAAASSAAAALSDADRAELARADAELIVGFDPSDFVQVVADQTFTDAEKAQALKNLSAASLVDLWFNARR